MRAVFQWLDAHPQSYWAMLALPTLLLVLRFWQSVRVEAATPHRPAPLPGWIDAVGLFLFLFAWRWPFLLVAYEYNPDESQMIAGAVTLVHDPVFWRAVDGGSSGPFNYYLLAPWHWFGLPLDYFTARVTCLLLTWGALFACLRTLARAFGPAAAWLGLLPAAAFFAALRHPELTNLSTEHLPLLLTAVAFGLLAGRAPGDRFRLWAACLVAGALPWTKLQSAPIGLALLGWAWWQVLREPGLTARLRWRRAAEVLLAAALPALLLGGMVAATGEMEAAWRRYILQNIVYTVSTGPGTSASVGEAVRAMWHNGLDDDRVPLFFYTILGGLLAATAYSLWRRVRPSALLVAGGIVSLVALAAVIAPRRDSLHYVLLLPVPLTLWFGAALGGWWRQLATARSRLALGGAALAAGLLPLLMRGLQADTPVYGGFIHHWKYPRSSAATVLHALTGRDDSLGIWGWACNLHVETGLRQATRDGTTLWSIEENPQRAYHRAVYLADLRRSAPAVFVDAVGPGAFSFEHRELQAHEIFPELAEYIRTAYVLVADTISARIYARRDLPVLADLGPATIDWLLAQGRPNRPTNPARPAATAAAALSRKQIDGRPTLKLEPPGLVEWPLDADIREVSLFFGFDPVAYEPGRSNGAGLILELTDGTRIRPLYRRQLDPAREPRDRGLQPVHLILPPFAPGTRLVLRTDPGLNGDTAWDWMHFTTPEFGRSPGFRREQFPDFDPLPTAVEAENSALVTTDGKTRLQLPPPAALHYELQGIERRLAFEYGLRPGAYTRGGRTDGAVFVVELVRAGEPPQTLFRRQLQPLALAADRGPQQLDLSLPALHRGDRLTLRIDAGPAGDSVWDWTYIASLKLH